MGGGGGGGGGGGARDRSDLTPLLRKKIRGKWQLRKKTVRKVNKVCPNNDAFQRRAEKSEELLAGQHH